MSYRRLAANVVPMRVGAAEHHIPLQRDVSLDTVKSVVSRIFSTPASHIKFSYVDEDEDTITINSTPEWYYAVGYLNSRPAPHNVVLVDFIAPFDNQRQAEIEVSVMPNSSTTSTTTTSTSSSSSSSAVVIEDEPECKRSQTVPAVAACESSSECKAEQEQLTSPVPSLSSTPTVHGAICDGCRSQVVGNRYKCNDCPDFDYCQRCYADYYHNRNVSHFTGHTFRLEPLSSCSFSWGRNFRAPYAYRGHCRRNFAPCPNTAAPTVTTPNSTTTTTNSTTTTTPTTAAAAPACASQPRRRHFNIVCDGCGSRDVSGARWKCAQCFDFDYCDACYTAFEESCDSNVVTPLHNARHVFIKIRKPATRSSLQVFAPFPNLYAEDTVEDLSITSGALNTISSQMRTYSRKLQLVAECSKREMESRLASSEKIIEVLKVKASKYDAIEEERLEAERKKTELEQKRQYEERARQLDAERQERARIEEERVRIEEERRKAEEEERKRLADELKSAVLEAARKDAEREEAARIQYAKELELLREMGFSDDLRNLTLLYRHNNVMDVLQKLME